MGHDGSQDLLARLARAKTDRKAVILAHNYQRPEVQDVADVVGDSLALARKAAATDAEVILFCGVHFMAETAAILSPDKTVLMPDSKAGCPLADMITEKELDQEIARLGNPVVITYVNSTAAIKARSDLCCTSSNAVAVVNAAPKDRPILFAPDRNLGAWAKRLSGRQDMTLWRGFCPTHNRILVEDVERARAAHPHAPVVVHPECRPEVVALADHVASTSGMLGWCRDHEATTFLIGTEIGMLHPLAKAAPGKTFLPLTERADCPNMKLTTIEKMVWALEDLSGRVTVADEIRVRALGAIERMVDIG